MVYGLKNFNMSFTSSELEIAQKYSLIEKIVPFLDRHLIYPIVASSDVIYGEKTVDQLCQNLRLESNDVKSLKENFQTLHPNEPLPQELTEKEERVNLQLEKLESETKPTLQVLAQKEVQEKLTNDKNHNQTYLSESLNITEEKINQLYEFGQLQYQHGNYLTAADLLGNFRALSTNNDLNLSATWGRLGSLILASEREAALEELTTLRDILDSKSFNGNPLQQLHNRMWIIHWSVFAFFFEGNSLEKLVDLFMSSSYLCTIQASCPWILRYLIVAIISTSCNKYGLNSKRMKELVKILKQEKYQHQDPFTQLVLSTFDDFDLSKSLENVKACEVLFKTDFFLSHADVKVFKHSCHRLLLEYYSKVFTSIKLNEFAAFNCESKEQLVSVLKELIEEKKVHGSFTEGELVLKHNHSSVYQQIIYKTKNVSYRSQKILLNTINSQKY